MAGHSKWANIKHKKAAQDAKRGKIFTKLIKEVTVAARVGGTDPEANPRLRAAIANAKKNSVPKDNIEKAVKKVEGGESEDFKEVTFEGYGPDGVAIFVEAATDNNQRTVANLRSYFNKHGGSLGKDGCLQFLFEKKAVFSVSEEDIGEDELTLEAADAGAEDVESDDGVLTVSGPMEAFGSLQKKMEELKIEPRDSGLQMVPVTMKSVDTDTFKTVMKLVEKLEDDDDVQKVYHNIEFTDELAQALD